MPDTSTRRGTWERTVGVVMFDHAPLFEMSVPLSVFGVDRSDSGGPRFNVLAIAGEAGPLTTTGGLRIEAPHELRDIRRCGVVVVPTWRDIDSMPPEPALAALRVAHARGSLVMGLCLGAFVLAAAGLLDGRRASTHWRYADALAAAYPRIEVDSSTLFTDEGDIVTSAGTAAGIDACLHVVRTRWGAQAANAIARRMVVAPQRAGGQAQYIEYPALEAPADGVGTVLADTLTRLDEDIDVDALAARANMSRRSFDRHCRAATGTSPLRWLIHQRVLRAQSLLESTDLGVDLVASRVGFSSAISLRPHFRAIVGVAPQEYRRLFRASSIAP